MEKLKNIVSGGHKKEDDLTHGSGQAGNPAGTGSTNTSGQGSHFGTSRTGNDPLSSSTNPASSTGTHGLSEPYSSRMPGNFDDDDAATTASVKSGIPGTSQSGSNVTGSHGLGADTNKSLPSAPTSQMPGSSSLGRDTGLNAGDSGRSFPLGGNSGNTSGYVAPGQTGTYPAGGVTSGNTTAMGSSGTAGPHSSNLANKADPRVDSDQDGSRGFGNEMYESSTTGAGGMSSGRGHGPDSWQHDHGAHGHQYGGDPCGPQDSAAAPHFTSGPHATDTANRLDPHVAGGTNTGGGILGSSPSSSTTPGTAGTGIGSSSVRPDQSSGLTGSTAGPGANRGYDSTTSGLGSSTAPSGSSETGPAPNTAGPHKSDMMNKADPRVDSDLSKQQGATGSGFGSSPGSGPGSSVTGTSDPYSSSTSGNHSGRNAGLAGAGAGLGGAAAYEGVKHRGTHDPTSTTSTAGAPGYGDSGSELTSTGANESDRHLGSHGMTPQDRLAGSSHQPMNSATSAPPQDRLAGSGHQPNMATTSSDPYSSMGREHHTGRDAAIGGAVGAGAGGLAAHEYSDRRNQNLAGSGMSPTSSNTAAGPHSSNLANKVDPRVDSDLDGKRNVGGNATGQHGTSAYGSSGQTPTTSRDHTGRDAALGAGAGAGAGGLAAHQYNDINDRNLTSSRPQPTGTADTSDPYTSTGHSATGQDAATGSSLGPATGSGLSGEPVSTSRDHHAGRDAALGGAGVGAGGLAAHEYSDKEAKKLEKEQHKEAKHADKEAHKHEKAAEKHEKHHDAGEKKPGLMDRLLHRHHDDKDTKVSEASTTHEPDTRKAVQPSGTDLDDRRHGGHPVGNEYEHGSSSGVHDPPIGSGHTTHDAYNTNEGHNKLHKDPPAKILEQRGLQ